MLISEIYTSRQGEGLLTGQPSVFIRTSGCNLRCWFCDTPFTSWAPEGENMSVDEIVRLADAETPRHAVITGGEPMLQKDLGDLCERLRRGAWHITIETAGTIERQLPCDLMSISPKMRNSTPDPDRAGEWSARHETSRYRPEVVRRLIEAYPYQLKFVIDQPEDVEEVVEYLEEVGEVAGDRVLLMPQGVDPKELARRSEWIQAQCDRLGFRFCPRKHIEWYGNKRGT